MSHRAVHQKATSVSLTFAVRMRLIFLSAAFALLCASTASADPPNARQAYVERRGLLEADSACQLFTPSLRGALQVGAAQARGALLRAGWSIAQTRDLEAAAAAAARARACTDQRTLTAAADARAAFASWVNAGTMEFPGWERSWIARRTAASGPTWRLSQAVDAPIPAIFGVRQYGETQRLTLIVPVARGETAPRSATLTMRDAGRVGAIEVTLPQRVAYGLAAGAPPPNAATNIPSTRTIERLDHGRSQAVFTFPDGAFRDLLALDPRESVVLRVTTARGSQSLYVEVGDIAAARAFLTLR
jgi:hypothetical protein